MFEAILNEIKAHDTIIIHRHHHPDGDALGSQIGLRHIISDNFPEKTVYCVGDGAGFFEFIDSSVMDDIPDDIYSDALAIVLDCGSSHLISDERYKTAKQTARIDHHLFAENICNVEVIDSSYESCCGLVAELAFESGLKLSPESAKALYTGMITDSGRFRYDSTSSNTFRLASFIMEQRFDTADIYKNLYSDTLESKKRKAMFTQKIQLTEKNVAYIYTTYEEFLATGMDSFSISRGMVNIMADTKGVDIWVNFTETEAGVLCELRSSKYNINPVAVAHGGGGHAKASGATLKDREEANEMLRELDEMIGDQI